MNNVRKFSLYAAFFVATIAPNCRAFDPALKSDLAREIMELSRENRELREKLLALEKTAHEDEKRYDDRKENLATAFLKCANENAHWLKKDHIPSGCRGFAAAYATFAGQDALKNLMATACFINDVK